LPFSIDSIIERMIRSSNDTPAPSQTLDRGLAALEFVARSEQPQSIADIAEHVGVHRSIAYRLIRTLEARNLIERDSGGSYIAAAGLAVLARSVRLDLRTAADPELRRLADQLGMTAFLVIRDGDEAITIASAEPTTTSVHVSYRPGARHPVTQGAPGLALQMGQPAAHREHTALRRARSRGWARSSGEVLPGMAAIGAPVGGVAAVAVLWLSGQPVNETFVAEAVMDAAARIAALLP
jgi:DNA-binding IclR family transcriptional regulator